MSTAHSAVPAMAFSDATLARFAREVANEVIFMDQGQVLEAAAPEMIFTDPRHERSKAFFGKILRSS